MIRNKSFDCYPQMTILLGLLVLLLVLRVDSYRVQISAVKSGKISNANAIKYVRYSRLYDNNKGIFTIIIMTISF